MVFLQHEVLILITSLLNYILSRILIIFYLIILYEYFVLRICYQTSSINCACRSINRCIYIYIYTYKCAFSTPRQRYKLYTYTQSRHPSGDSQKVMSYMRLCCARYRGTGSHVLFAYKYTAGVGHMAGCANNRHQYSRSNRSNVRVDSRHRQRL